MSALEKPASDAVSALGLIPLCPTSRYNLLSKASPILKQRISMMTSEGDADWVRYLTWDGSQADDLQVALTCARGCDESEELAGYIVLDSETYLAVVKATVHVLSTELETTLWFKFCLGIDAATNLLKWQLYEINTCLLEETHPDHKLLSSLDEIKSLAAARSANADMKSYPSFQEKRTSDENIESEDDYWGQYDNDEEASQNEPELEAPSGGDDYYTRYEQEVDTAIRSDSPDLTRNNANVQSPDPVSPTDMDPLLPGIVRHVERSFESLRELCRASNLSDKQIWTIFEKVMQDGPI